MGSGSKSRSKDRGVVGGGGGGSSAGGKSQCPMSFRVKLETKLKLKDGTKLYLQKDNDECLIFAGTIKIGQLKKGQATLILGCIDSGVKYEGRVGASGEGVLYGEFSRTA